uniref:Uncharacterized protein n=1 Tax=Romanomermis culicivorax TaxID=13658 RepID=A0A915JXN9_ROMCU
MINSGGRYLGASRQAGEAREKSSQRRVVDPSGAGSMIDCAVESQWTDLAPIMASNNTNNMATAEELLTAKDKDARILAPMERRPKLAEDHTITSSVWSASERSNNGLPAQGVIGRNDRWSRNGSMAATSSQS